MVNRSNVDILEMEIEEKYIINKCVIERDKELVEFFNRGIGEYLFEKVMDEYRCEKVCECDE